MKVLRPELAAVIGAERFLAEIRTTANLQHPHILPLFDSGVAQLPSPEQSEGPPEHRNVPPPERSEGPPEHRNVPPPERSEGPQSFLYYVMPYVDGISLRDRLTHADPGAIARRIVYTAF